MSAHPIREFLARSTERAFDDTTLAKLLAAMPSIGPEGPWLAGGSLRRTLLQREPDSDLDYFFKDADQLSAFVADLEKRGFEKVRETEHHVQYRGRIGDSGLPVDIQCIRFAFYADAAAVIDSFDFTICQFAFDGENLTVGEYALWDLGRKRLAVHKITYPVSSMRRVLKYASQGFKACNGCLQTLLRATAENPAVNMEVAYVD